MQLKSKAHNVLQKVGTTVKENFISATVNFAIIMAFMQVFPRLFGAENSIIGVILTIFMGIWAHQGFDVKPVQRFVSQTVVLGCMVTAACFSVALGPWTAIPINLFVIFPILYHYTYEYSGSLYFPYILSYLFMLFISPVSVSALPMRLLSVLAGSACMAVYAVAAGLIQGQKSARKCLREATAEAALLVDCLLRGDTLPDNAMKLRKIVYRMSRLADEHKKNRLCVPDSALALLDAGRGIESLSVILHDPIWSEVRFNEALLETGKMLNSCRKFGRGSVVPVPNEAAFSEAEELYRLLLFIREKVCRAAVKSVKSKTSATKTSLKEILRREYSPVRLAYAVRVTLLVTLFIIPVQALQLPHGKWLIFTLASVSLPYSEDVTRKGLRRFVATVIGGSISMLCFSIIPGQAARTALMMLSGYLSFYFPGYTGNYACATFGALGGAVMALTGWKDVGAMFGLRIAYIALGIGIAFVFNLLVCPFRRKKASENMYRKYDETAKLLSKTNPSSNPQLYYGLVIHNNLIEEKLLENSTKSDGSFLPHLRACREQIYRAHYGGNPKKA